MATLYATTEILSPARMYTSAETKIMNRDGKVLAHTILVMAGVK
jgi:hypothetical protein